MDRVLHKLGLDVIDFRAKLSQDFSIRPVRQSLKLWRRSLENIVKRGQIILCASMPTKCEAPQTVSRGSCYLEHRILQLSYCQLKRDYRQ